MPIPSKIAESSLNDCNFQVSLKALIRCFRVGDRGVARTFFRGGHASPSDLIGVEKKSCYKSRENHLKGYFRI